MYMLTLLLISNHNNARVEPALFGCVFERRRLGGTKPISANFPLSLIVLLTKE